MRCAPRAPKQSCRINLKYRFSRVNYNLPGRNFVVLHYWSHARPNSGISGDLLSENEAKPAVITDAVAEDAIVWSTLLSILPSLTDEEDVSAGRRRVLIA